MGLRAHTLMFVFVCVCMCVFGYACAHAHVGGVFLCRHTGAEAEEEEDGGLAHGGRGGHLHHGVPQGGSRFARTLRILHSKACAVIIRCVGFARTVYVRCI